MPIRRTVSGDDGRLERRTVHVRSRRTTVALEPVFWKGVDGIAAREGTGLSTLLSRIDEVRGKRPLAAAVRVFAISYYRGAARPTPFGNPEALEAALAAVAMGG